jgi:hypothetical protein
LPDGLHQFDHVVAGGLALISIVQAFADPNTFKQLPPLAFFKAAAATGLMMGGLVLLSWHLAGRPVGDFGLSGWIGPNPLAAALAAILWPLLLVALARLLWARYRKPAAQFYAS